MAERDEKKEEKPSKLSELSTLIQVLSVIVASLLSIWSFNDARQKEAEARISEADKYRQQREDEARKQQIEAVKPFLEIRQQTYMEAVKVAGILANPKDHTPQEIKSAEKRFAALYWAELSLVEGTGVEASMVGLAGALGKYKETTPEQRAALNLAHALRDSLVKSWGIEEKHVGPVNK